MTLCRPVADSELPLDRSAEQREGHQPTGEEDPEYALSLGKIVDTLRSDLSEFLVREPNWDIYDAHVVLELAWPLPKLTAARGKEQYVRAINRFQRFSLSAFEDASVCCQVYPGKRYGHALRVNWTLSGRAKFFGRPASISAISLYSVRAQVDFPTDVLEADAEARGGGAARRSSPPELRYKIHQHVIQFVEIHPPALQTLLSGVFNPHAACGRSVFAAIGPSKVAWSL